MALGAIADPSVDSEVAGGGELMAAVDAAVLRDHHELPEARSALIAAVGEAAAVRAFATTGNFEMMNRLLDGLGVMPAPASRGIGAELGVPFVAHHEEMA